ncbi:MAG: hypothetical protein Q8L48_02620 [Archangium sp.]|nr:hypothetical protein [Archangium sp.]
MKRGVFSLVVLLSAAALADDLPKVDPALAELAVPLDGDPFSIDEHGRLSIAVNHGFARPEAAARLGYLLSYWKKRFNIASEWRGDRVFLSGSVYGIKIQAMFAINDSSVVGFAHDPGWPWRGQVQHYVNRKLKKYLNVNYDDP